MNKTFRFAGDLPLLAHYQKIIRQQQILLQQIKQALPENLAEQVKYCVTSGKKLLLYTESANWSSSLRFYQQAVLQKAQQAGWTHLQLLQVKVIPERVAIQKPTKPRHPSSGNVKMIQQVAEKQTDRKLKQALSRLGATLTKSSVDS